MEQTPKGACDRGACSMEGRCGLGPEAERYRADARYRTGYGALARNITRKPVGGRALPSTLPSCGRRETLIEEMRRFVRGESYDERPWPDVDSEALDFRAASESFAEFRTLKENDLDVLRLCTMHQGRHGWRHLAVRRRSPCPFPRCVGPSGSLRGPRQVSKSPTTRMRVTMAAEPIDRATADPIDQAILDLLDSGDRTTSEIAGAIGRSTRATRTRLSRLVDQGRLVAIGRGPQDPRRVYRKA